MFLLHAASLINRGESRAFLHMRLHTGRCVFSGRQACGIPLMDDSSIN